jgi:pyruvate-ferredoxin/flavodoxin oxidoreductase
MLLHPHARRTAGRAPLQTLAKFDSEFRAGLGYHQPAGALASVGLMGAGTGATQSKYVARRETPVYIAENCTQCMECITACPDTALPNTAQEITTVLKTAVNNYVTSVTDRLAFGAEVPRSKPARARR